MVLQDAVSCRKVYAKLPTVLNYFSYKTAHKENNYKQESNNGLGHSTAYKQEFIRQK